MSTEIKQNLIDRLFKAGAHFGFGKSRRHPTSAPYLFGTKQGTDIFDLEKTSDLIADAKSVLEEAGRKGETVLFVGTKDEVSALVKATAEAVDMPYVTNRWIGGMLTNFSEIKKRIARLLDLTAQGESGELERKYTKKERVMIGRELTKLTHNFGGIKTVDRTPNLMVVVDPRHDAIAVREANELDVPTVAITSSDANLAVVTHPILVNDALRSSVALVLKELADSYAKGRSEYVPPAPAAKREFRSR
ncbi:30S ribosomal protein S2 [Candidatus Parcubacteria bacterium]|uniref:Small ribosomal subunit protein uS2 n=1 Tax=Candidatus Kaiserbacteria bacterium CG10_big_fil_rev_8_21_14_0_10_47_16 TaxID=1974608 RepID=A0A2H0UE57_9BACT|nr:30S ribosomal protein S2 [Candidatus Parcubacteria bacterium]PIR84704.1 MAG: 30S ribosomal protein S2 [Candidatus Kaiserbacteria bacterium CG10_big_fil_rev_8_21_14_0_10_47_16]